MTTTTKNWPRQGQVYTLAEITKLHLRDQPFLNFMHNGVNAVIQSSSVDERDVCEKLPGAAETRWKYIRETHEWIPIFYFGDDNERPITDFVTIEPDNNQEGHHWVCWKGFFQEQYQERTWSQIPDSELPVPPAASPDSWASIPGWDKMAQSSEELPAPPAEVNIDLPMPPVLVDLHIPFLSAKDLAAKPELAALYLLNRADDYAKLKEQMPMQDDAQGIRVYESGIVERYPANHPSGLWGRYNPPGSQYNEYRGEKFDFASEECFHAWVLARFW